MATALTHTITTLPRQLRRSLTQDRGKELSAHAQFSIASGVKVYFADPKSPWQRGTKETPTAFYANTFRRALTCPAGMQTTSQPSLTPLNTRRRKALGWRTPAEAFNEHLRSLQQPGVATTS